MKKTLVALALATASLAAYAAPIGGLVNDNTGTGMSAGSMDTDYMVSFAGGTATAGFVADPTTYPASTPWIATGTDSKWLSPVYPADSNQAPGTYDWLTTFNLSANDNPLSASFSGQFSADNSAVIYLNGHQITGTSTGYTAFSAFSVAINSGFFKTGLNTVDFRVTNVGGPTGLRAEFTTSDVSPVPEPETYAMLLAGLGLMGFMARRRKA